MSLYGLYGVKVISKVLSEEFPFGPTKYLLLRIMLLSDPPHLSPYSTATIDWPCLSPLVGGEGSLDGPTPSKVNLDLNLRKRVSEKSM